MFLTELFNFKQHRVQKLNQKMKLYSILWNWTENCSFFAKLYGSHFFANRSPYTLYT